MDYFDVKEIERNRPSGEGCSLDGENYDYVKQELERLGEAIDEWLARHKNPDADWNYTDSGIENSGHCFANGTFCCLAYDWSDGKEGNEEWGPRNVNFYHFPTKTDITWYKYYTRGTYAYTADTIETIEERRFSDVIDDCIASLNDTDENEWHYTAEGKYGWY